MNLFSMNILYFLSAIFAVMSLTSSCQPTANQRGVDAQLQMVGGRYDYNGKFSSSVAFEHCGATKIGERHFLTAAHCVYEEAGKELKMPLQIGNILPMYYQPTISSLTSSNGTLDESQQEAPGYLTVQVTIENVYIHNTYLEFVKNFEFSPNSPANDQLTPYFYKISDMALIIIKETTPEISVAEFALTSKHLKPVDILNEQQDFDLNKLQKIYHVGWGIDGSVPDIEYKCPEPEQVFLASGPSSQLQWRETAVISNIPDSAEFATLPSPYPIIIGEKLQFYMAPGDSGSGVFIDTQGRDKKTLLIGINSNVNGCTKLFNSAKIDNASQNCILERINQRQSPQKAANLPEKLCQ